MKIAFIAISMFLLGGVWGSIVTCCAIELIATRYREKQEDAR